MYMNELRSRISIEQRRQLNSLVFVLIVVLFSVVTSAVAPQLLYEYVLQDVSVDQQLLILQYIPVIAYLVALVAFVMSVFGFMSHRRRVNLYEQEIMMLEYSDDECNCDDPNHSHNMEVVEETLTISDDSLADLSAAMSNTGSTTRRAPAKKRAATKRKSK